MQQRRPDLKYATVATGGTYDHIHRGHLAMLTRSFEVGDRVVIGVTSDAFALKEGKKPDQKYDERVRALEALVRAKFPGRRYLIAKLDDYFGPGITSPDVQAIVVSRETAKRVPIANAARAAKGFAPLDVVTVDYVLADDREPISSTRIRNGEIDTEGRVIRPRSRL
ncbi:MAG: pantetheine-phosphate adenylyltransferase [Nitrososphaerota archaeon]|nr:pantetheine-phosphate adenylyltransferase [Nitrososphaerota archaeon]MDG7024561.1 pantetheine-phosphate adenylyltransferase [Nitrososphaerota archaeon]